MDFYKLDININTNTALTPAEPEGMVDMDLFMLVLIVGGSLGALSGVLALILGCIVVAWMITCWRARASSVHFHDSKQRKTVNMKGNDNNDIPP